MSEFRFIGTITDSIEFLVDNDVPIPTGLRENNTVRLREVLNSMAVGQSTTIPIDPKTGRAAVKVSNAVRDVEGKDFTQRVVIENFVKLVRVWRIA